jgi:hypothetical protein
MSTLCLKMSGKRGQFVLTAAQINSNTTKVLLHGDHAWLHPHLVQV